MQINKVGDEIKYISGIIKKVVVHDSKVISVDEENGIIELENAMKLKFLHKSKDGGIFDSYRNMANGQNVLVDSRI